MHFHLNMITNNSIELSVRVRRILIPIFSIPKLGGREERDLFKKLPFLLHFVFFFFSFSSVLESAVKSAQSQCKSGF